MIRMSQERDTLRSIRGYLEEVYTSPKTYAMRREWFVWTSYCRSAADNLLEMIECQPNRDIYELVEDFRDLMGNKVTRPDKTNMFFAAYSVASNVIDMLNARR